MFLIISKWTPNYPGTRYVSLQEVHELIKMNNRSVEGNPLIPDAYYNQDIFQEWAKAARNFRNAFSAQDFINYDTYKSSSNPIVYTLQIYKNKTRYAELYGSQEHNLFESKRQNFLECISVSTTVRYLHQELTELPPNYEAVVDMFENASSSFE